MQVFNIYMKLLKRTAPFLMIYTLVFTGLLVVNSFYHNKITAGFEETKVRTAIVNYDRDSFLVQNLLNYLDQYCELEDFTDKEKLLNDALYFKEVSYIITIPYDFGEEFIKGEDVFVEKKTIPETKASSSVDNVINNYFNTAGNYIKNHPNEKEEELVKGIQNELDSLALIKTADSENIDKSHTFYLQYFNTIALTITVCCLLGIGIIMSFFQNQAVQRRNMVSPIIERNVSMQLLLGNIIFIISNDIFFILVGFIINPEKKISVSLILFWLNLIVFSSSLLAISYIILQTAKTRQTVFIISIILAFVLSFISGAVTPQSTLSNFILKLAAFSPVFWFVKANNTIVSFHKYDWSNLQTLIYYMAIELGFAAVFFAISLVIRKNRALKE